MIHVFIGITGQTEYLMFRLLKVGVVPNFKKSTVEGKQINVLKDMQ